MGSIVWQGSYLDGINELISMDGLHGKSGVIGFFGVFVCGFQFYSMWSTGFIGDGQVQSRVSGDDKIVAVVSKVEVILHHEAKMALLSTTIWAQDIFWFTCCWITSMPALVGLLGHAINLGYENHHFRT